MNETVKLALSLCFANDIIPPTETVLQVSEYIAFPSAKEVFDVEKVEKQKIVNIGKGIKVSKPVNIGIVLMREGYVFIASISHNGVIAINSFNGTLEELKVYNYTQGDRKYIIQFTDLLSTRQVEMEVENSSLVGFYDNSMILLTFYQPLREAAVESVFDNPTPDMFKRVGSVGGIGPYTDVSLLHSTRVLYYRDTDYIPYEYNVDTHINTELDIGKKVMSFASMTGIDVGVKGIFKEYEGGWFTFTLNRDNTTTKIGGKQSGCLRNFLPSSTYPSDIEKGMLKYWGYFIFNKKKIEPTTPIKFEYSRSLVRIYRDIFLAYDLNTEQWALIRIIVHLFGQTSWLLRDLCNEIHQSP